MVVIKNKRTQQEQIVTEDEWTVINTHPNTAGKWVVIMNKAENELVKAGKIKMIMPEEILSFKKNKVETLKAKNKTNKSKEI